MATIQEKIDEVERRREQIKKGGGTEQIEKQHRSGKLTARERISKLVDPGSFVELDVFAKPRRTGFDIDKRDIPGDAVVTGFGEIDGRHVCVYAQDFTALGGTMAQVHAMKVIKIMEMALEMRVPCIGMIDSGGVRIQDSFNVQARDTYARLFYLHTQLSGVVPQISLMMGPCAAGASYSPMLGDLVFMVDKTSHMYIASPALIEAVTSRKTTEDEIGSPKVHAEVSGCCDLVASGDEDCLKKTREVLGFLPLNNREMPPVVPTGDDPNRSDPSLLEIVPVDPQKPFDMRKVIKRVVDDGYFFELKPDFARNMVTGLARLDGHSVGIVANQSTFLAGAIDINASDKEARFIRFCDAFNIPLIFFVDTPAFLPGVEQERGGIIRHGAKVLYAISEATVPKISLRVRKAYGGGAAAMAGVGHAMGTNAVLNWPTVTGGLMGLLGAINIIYRKEIEAAENPEEVRQQRLKELMEQVGREEFQGTHGTDLDDVIDPRETRPVLIKYLRLLNKKGPETRAWKKHGNIPL